MTLEQEAHKLSPDTYLELFDFDASVLLDSQGIPGTISYYTNTSLGGLTGITWRGNNYLPLPVEITGVGSKGDGSAPNRPNIAISNAEKVLMSAILSIGDLAGLQLTRWRTFFKYTDNGSEPNILNHFPTDLWVFRRKVNQNRHVIQYELSNPLDRPGLLLPRKQVIRDQGFPGVSRIRLR